MLTIKSDDLIGRTRAYRAIITGQPVPEPGIPESFKLLVRELNGLVLDIETIGVVESEEEDEDVLKAKIISEKSSIENPVVQEVVKK
jgi:DNA-directed RNA polymerase subunit beta